MDISITDSSYSYYSKINALSVQNQGISIKVLDIKPAWFLARMQMTPQSVPCTGYQMG